jgi:hypothetical protein
MAAPDAAHGRGQAPPRAPLERLCAPVGETWGHLALNQSLPFSLSIPTLSGRRFPPIGPRDLRALILVASPAGEPAFDVAAAVEAARVSLGNKIRADVLARVPGVARRPWTR